MNRWKQRSQASALRDESLAVDHPTWDFTWQQESAGVHRPGLVAASRAPQRLEVVAQPEETTGELLKNIGVGLCVLAAIAVVAGAMVWWGEHYTVVTAIALFAVAALAIALIIGRTLRYDN